MDPLVFFRHGVDPGQQFEYTFDDIGNRTESKAGGDSAGGSLRTTSYTPNPLNQYTARTIPGGFDVTGLATDGATVSVNSSSSGVYRRGDYFQKTLTVDNSGNAVWQNVTVSSSTGGSLSPGSKFIPKAAEAPQHDLDGNLESDGRWVYTWDAENRLVKMESHATAPSASRRRLEFEYDHQSRRIRKTVETWNGSAYALTDEIRFIYDGWNLIAELNANLTPRRSFTWGLDLSGSIQGAGGVGGLLFVHEHTGSATHAVAHDGNGNVAALFSLANGFNSARYEYGPFGEVIRASGTMAKLNPFHFSTKYEDGESGLLYYGYRFYNPETGRWLNRDPLGERGGLQLYGFVSNTPANGFDRLGLIGGWGVGNPNPPPPGWPGSLPNPTPHPAQPAPAVLISVADNFMCKITGLRIANTHENRYFQTDPRAAPAMYHAERYFRKEIEKHKNRVCRGYTRISIPSFSVLGKRSEQVEKIVAAGGIPNSWYIHQDDVETTLFMNAVDVSLARFEIQRCCCKVYWTATVQVIDKIGIAPDDYHVTLEWLMGAIAGKERTIIRAEFQFSGSFNCCK